MKTLSPAPLVLALAAVLAATATAQTPALPLPEPLKPRLTSPDAKELGNLIADKTLSIDDAVSIALATSRPYATAIANLERARGRTGEVRSGLNPTLNVGSQITEYDNPQVAAFGPGSAITLVNQFNSIFNAAVSLPIDISGAIHAAASQAQFSEVAARIDVNRVRNSLVFDVRNAFYQALRAKGQLVVSQDNLANANARLQDAQTMLKAGTGTQFDVLTAQRDVADAEQSVVNARGAVTLALASLKLAMGIDISTPIKIADAGAVEEPTEAAPAPQPTEGANGMDRLHEAEDEVDLGPEYQDAVKEALGARPEVLESNAALTAAERGVDYERRRQLPSVTATAGYVWQPTAAGFTPEKQGSVGLTISIPVFDGGRAKARIQEARAGVASAQTDRRNAIDQITLDVQQAYVNLQSARQRVLVANVGLGQAREAFRLARLRSQVGVSAIPGASPQLELSNAQTTLTQAETNRVNALYDYNIARSQLARAVGRYSYGTGAGFSSPPTPSVTGEATPPNAGPARP